MRQAVNNYVGNGEICEISQENITVHFESIQAKLYQCTLNSKNFSDTSILAMLMTSLVLRVQCLWISLGLGFRSSRWLGHLFYIGQLLKSFAPHCCVLFLSILLAENTIKLSPQYLRSHDRIMMKKPRNHTVDMEQDIMF